MEFLEHKLGTDQAKRFVFGGNSIFTIRSKKTGNRFTFRVKKSKNPYKDVFWVSLLNGSDNVSDYKYIGAFSDKYYAKNNLKALSTSAIRWFLEGLDKGRDLGDLEIFHAGRCGRCARLLTVPESVESGFGPECVTKV